MRVVRHNFLSTEQIYAFWTNDDLNDILGFKAADVGNITDACSTITSSKTVTSDVSATATCFTIGANSITLDCNGYTINYGSAGAGVGVSNTGFDDVTIKNCVITKSGTAGNTNYGILMTSAAHRGLLQDNTIRTNGGNTNHGIFIDAGSNYTSVMNNNIYTSGTDVTGNNYGILAQRVSSNTNASHNFIQTGGGPFSYGIYFALTASNETALNNTIYTNSSVGTAENNVGIALENAKNATIIENQIVTNGTYDNYGMWILSATTNSIIRNNRITTRGSQGNNWGIRIDDTSGDNWFINNNFTNTPPTDHIIRDNTVATVNNFLVYNNTWGEINWIYNGTGSFLTNLTINVTNDKGLGLDKNIFIGNNTLAFNSSAFFPLRINQTSVNLTLFGLDFPSIWGIFKVHNFTLDPAVIQTGGFDCSLSSCIQLSYSGGVLRFNTTGFSSFAAKRSLCSTIASDTTLTESASSTGTCMTIGASGITLDCKGYEITYGTNGRGAGVSNNGDFDNTVITNCVIKKGATGGTSNNYAVNISNGAFGTLIINNTIVTDGISNNFGIFLSNSVNNSRIENNSIYTNGTGLNNEGISVAAASNYNEIINNIIETRGNRNNYGLQLSSGSNHSIIRDNALSTGGTINLNHGIYANAVVGNNSIL